MIALPSSNFVLHERISAGVTNLDGPRLAHAACDDLTERRFGFLHEQVHRMQRTLLAERAEAPHEAFADKCRIGADGQCADNVCSAAYTRIHKHGGATSHVRHDG